MKIPKIKNEIWKFKFWMKTRTVKYEIQVLDENSKKLTWMKNPKVKYEVW